MKKTHSAITRNKGPKHRKLSLYPLKFDEVISDVLKIKPEPKRKKPKRPKGRNK